MSAFPSNLSADELALRLSQQELVAEFGLFALAGGSIGRLLDEACRLVSEGLRTHLAKVLRYRTASGDLLVVAGVGWRPGVVGHSVLPGGMDSPAGFTLHTGSPTLSRDLAQEARFQTPVLLLEHGVLSAINVLIGHPGQVPFGVLEADSTRRHDFIDADQAFLQAVANILAAGLARIEAEQAVEKLVAEKDLLIKEVHHRVSNSLQLVRTMLSLQARGASDDTRRELDMIANRIMSIAAVHRRLHETTAGGRTDAAAYLRTLLADMTGLLDVPGAPRTLDLQGDSILLEPDSLTALGLIVTELVSNGAKHGAGRITVALMAAPAGLEVVVTDEGPGFGAERTTGTAGSGLGMRLIRSLAKGDPAQAVQADRSVPFGRITVLLTL